MIITREPHLVECMRAGEFMSELVFISACRDAIGAVLDHRAIIRAAFVNRELFERSPEVDDGEDFAVTRWRVTDMEAWLDVLRALDAERRLGEQEKGTWIPPSWAGPERA